MTRCARSPLAIFRRSPTHTRCGPVMIALVLLAFGCSSGDDAASDASDPDATETASAQSSEANPAATASPTTTSSETRPTSQPSTTTEQPLSLEEQIVVDMQGAQSEYLDAFGEAFGDDLPTLVFFHRGDWAVEAGSLPGSDQTCALRTFQWSVTDAVSESEFTIVYDELTEDPDCVPFPSTSFEVEFSGPRQVDNRPVYDITYTEGLGDGSVTGTRTVCSPQWDDPEPCGLTLPGFDMPTPPPD